MTKKNDDGREIKWGRLQPNGNRWPRYLSKCGRYEIVRINADTKYGSAVSRFDYGAKEVNGDWYRLLDTLEEAKFEVEQHASKQAKKAG